MKVARRCLRICARLLLALAPVGLAPLLPAAALACPNCYGSSGTRVLQSYYLSAVVLSLLPFAIIGTIMAVVWHLKRRLDFFPQDPTVQREEVEAAREPFVVIDEMQRRLGAVP